jgi:hypothetical protein
VTTDEPAPPEQRTVQNNYGSGAFIGRDQYRDINIHHEIDPQTKATLAKLGKSAPAGPRRIRCGRDSTLQFRHAYQPRKLSRT